MLKKSLALKWNARPMPSFSNLANCFGFNDIGRALQLLVLRAGQNLVWAGAWADWQERFGGYS